MTNKAVAVSEIVGLIKSTLDNNIHLQQVSMLGELSNVAISANNHWYFTLKDEKARLSCVMFSNVSKRIKTPFKEGDQVIVFGRISLYEASGNIQCYVMDMQLSGIGNLYVQLEKTRKKLAEQGYFDESKKKPIPRYPQNIGLITSNQTAAYHDVMSTLSRRWPLAKINFYHSQVQGEAAVNQLIEALKYLDNQQHLDCILMVRGGGSIEDLWCFNDERVVLEIASCRTPIISGVGHESDITLIDYVVDKRAPTPTGAAELATPHKDDVLFSLLKQRELMHQSITKTLHLKRHNLETLKSHRFVNDPQILTSELKHTLEISKNRLLVAVDKLIQLKDNLSHDRKTMHQLIKVVLESKKQALRHQKTHLHALSHQSALKRGYSITYQQGKIIKSVHDVNQNQQLITLVSDGTIASIVKEAKEKNHE